MVLIVKRLIYCTIILTCFYLASCSGSLSQHTLRDFELGKEALKKENYDEAIGYFKSYLEKSPQDAEAHLQLGLALLKKGSLRRAVDEFKQSVNINPKSEEARTLIKKSIFDEANTFFIESKNDIGMRYLTAYLTINPDDVDTHIILAKEFIKMGSTRNAISSLNKAVSLDPKNPQVIELLDYFSDGFH
jgi:tetratricopeptide (TPR) repeat protein